MAKPSGQPLVVQGIFSGIESDLSHPEYVRIATTGGLFFAHLDHFQHNDLFDILRPGDMIVAGVHVLDGGGYWLHWLYSPGKGIAETKRTDPDIPWSAALGFIGLLTAFGGVWLLETSHFLYGPVIGTGAVFLALGMPGMLGLILFFAGKGMTRRALDAGLEKARQEIIDPSLVSRGKIQSQPETLNVDLDNAGDVRDSLEAVTGTVQEASVERREYDVEGNVIARNTLFFTCSGRKVAWTCFNPHRQWLSAVSDFSPNRPPFLASGDRVTAVLSKNENWRPTSAFNPKIQGDYDEAVVLANLTDGQVFLPESCISIIAKARRLLYPLALATLYILFELGTGLMNDWAGCKYPGVLLIPGFIVGWLFAFILLVFELFGSWKLIGGGVPAFSQRLDFAIISSRGFTRKQAGSLQRSRSAAMAWIGLLAAYVAAMTYGFFHVVNSI